jgi:bifunctional UDP-N-acetylglucosamine pyrophosphorylase/glucosamine-1-phosphate N-acetyltransferase
LSIDRDRIALILAAGKGKRMKSDIPKVLHKVHNKYLVNYVINNTRKAGIEKQIIVIGHQAEMVKEALKENDVQFALQEEQLGTGHAVMMAEHLLENFDGDIIVLCGDMPLIRPSTIKKLIGEKNSLNAVAVVLSVVLDDPGKYGRIVRDENNLLKAITEYRDADDKIKAIKEVNTGAYCFDWKILKSKLNQLSDDNDQKEYYLTDIIGILVADGQKVGAIIADDSNEGFGINSTDELSMVEELIKSGTY